MQKYAADYWCGGSERSFYVSNSIIVALNGESKSATKLLWCAHNYGLPVRMSNLTYFGIFTFWFLIEGTFTEHEKT